MLAKSLILTLLFVGCAQSKNDGQSEDPSTPTIASPGGRTASTTYGLCNSVLTGAEFMQFFNGNLVFVAEHEKSGKAASEAIGDLVTNMVVNGLDFAKLADYGFSFSDGDYTFGVDGYGYTFSLFFAEDFAEFHAGDKIPYNVFTTSSYVTNVHVTLSPKPSYSYDEGPLFDLVDGSVKFSGATLSGLNAKLNLKADLIAFEMKSVSDVHGQVPREGDVVHLNVTTTRATLSEVNEQFQAGGFGVSYDGTTYTSPYFGVDQAISANTFYMKKDDTGFYWEGEYVSSVAKNAVTYYQKGFASSRDQNRTEYYCDAALAAHAGTALHDLDLKGGTFTFEDGATFAYRLEDF